MNPPGKLNIAAWLPRSAVNGPGERFVIWLQGCRLRCPGCVNEQMWSDEPRHLLSVDELLALILATGDLKGVTLSGGEPFHQARALAPLAGRIKEAGLTLMAWTGHELDELAAPPARDLLRHLDILITGRFIREQRTTTLPWRGSRNQEVRFLSPAYSHQSIPSYPGSEIHIQGDTMTLTGTPLSLQARAGHFESLKTIIQEN